jgi:carbon starvation protein CstA
MASSMVGSIIQLPGVGGGSQLATISMLNHIFEVPPELATSCGIMLWLVTFVAVVPVGLLLAHRERLSLRKLSTESHQAEESTADNPAA